MNVTIAKSAGFCFGVKRAVNMVYEAIAKESLPIYTYGPIIHNEEVVKSIEKRQNELIGRLFSADERSGVNACRLVTRALELRIIDIDNLEPDEE